MSSTDPFGLIGQVLDGQFRVDKFVGEGGFSVVYRGHHVGLNEPIAIKCLKLPIALGSALVESFVKRFRDESRLHYRLSQGSLFIVRTLAHGMTMAPATGALVPYMVLEWLDGRSLAADLEVRRAYGDSGRSLEEAIALLDSAVDGLAYAHAQGVVHRDVNPGNLFMTNTALGPRLKLLDFGVAKVISDHALSLGPRAQTIGQIRIFSPQYAAPEQFDDTLGPIGSWSDVYSLALIVLEVLRDRPAIEGEHLGDFASRALDPLSRPTPRALGVATPDETESVLASAVALKRALRPQDAGEFWGALKAAMRRDALAGNLAFADAPKPAEDASGPPNTAAGPRVPPGRTLSVERVPIPVRPSAPASPPALEMPPETARMPAAYAAQRATPLPPPGAPSMAQPSMQLESAVPPTPPATDVQVPPPPPPVPNVFELAPPARTGSHPAFGAGTDTLSGAVHPYANPAAAKPASGNRADPFPSSLLYDAVPPSDGGVMAVTDESMVFVSPNKPLQMPPRGLAPYPPAPNAPDVGLTVPMREVTSPMPAMPMGTVMMPRPSTSAAPPAALPTLAMAASQPPPNAPAFPAAPVTLPVVNPSAGPDSEHPTRIAAGALDVFASLYSGGPARRSEPQAPMPQQLPQPQAPTPAFAPWQTAVPTVTTRAPRRSGGAVIIVLVLLVLVAFSAYAAYLWRSTG